MKKQKKVKRVKVIKCESIFDSPEAREWLEEHARWVDYEKEHQKALRKLPYRFKANLSLL
jgi:hypothetical protein